MKLVATLANGIAGGDGVQPIIAAATHDMSKRKLSMC
jgi:hypothetical protein